VKLTTHNQLLSSLGISGVISLLLLCIYSLDREIFALIFSYLLNITYLNITAALMYVSHYWNGI
jgi:hypothetical protein